MSYFVVCYSCDAMNMLSSEIALAEQKFSRHVNKTLKLLFL